MSNGNSERPIRVFVSSTWKDLEPERNKVEAALDRLQESSFTGMEHTGSQPGTTREVSLADVDRSDIYVGIFAHRYGSGITEAEYDRARERGIPCLIYFKDKDVLVHPDHVEREPDQIEKLEALYKKLRKNHTCSDFDSPDNLATGVVTDLRNEIAQLKPTKTGRTTIPAPPQPYFAHPYPLQPNFTGRVRERTMLTEWLMQDEQPVLALVAFGGMGKSALSWAWLLRDVLGLPLPGAVADAPEDAETCRVPDDARPEGVFWWSFYEKDSTFEGFLNQALAYASGGEPPAVEGAYEKMEALVGLLRERRLLLVLDGFERLLRQYASLEAVYQKDDEGDVPPHDRACSEPNAATFLRRLAGGPFDSKVLLTSRLFPKELEGDGSEAVANCRLEKLESMDPMDAVAFLRAQGIKGNRGEIEAACQPYGYQPLALRLLAGVIVNDKQTPGDVRAAERHGLLKEPKGERLRQILEIAYNALDRHRRALLSRIAAFRSPVDYEAVEIFKTKKISNQFDGALDELTERGLLLRGGVDARFDLHPLVRRYAYERLRDKKRVHERLAEYFATLPVPDEKDVKSVEDLAPVIELYHHTVGAGRHDEARVLYDLRSNKQLYYRLGAYQTCIELLRALFPDGEGALPRLREQGDQAWTLNALANAYSVYGQSRRAISLFEQQNTIQEEHGQKVNLAIGQRNLADDERKLGTLAAAESDFRKCIAVAREAEDTETEAAGRQELARLLGFEGQFVEAEQELAKADAFWDDIGNTQGSCLNEAYRARAALAAADPEAGLEAARRARDLADEVAKETHPYERDFVRAEWLIGACLVARAHEDNAQRETHLAEAETHLTNALTRCRRINMVDHEPDILLAWARWHEAKANNEAAFEHANEALSVADRCEYRLQQADIHNFLAALALDEDDRESAIKHAQKAFDYAVCDGTPHVYKPALDEAERLLKALGVEPPEVPPYEE